MVSLDRRRALISSHLVELGTPTTRFMVFLAVLALPLWVGVIGAPHRVWLGSSLNLFTAESLYEVAPLGTNPHSTRYVYLPTFAYATAALVFIPASVDLAMGGTLNGFKHPAGVLTVAVWGYFGYLAAVYTAGAVFEDRRRWVAMVAVAALPLAFVAGLYRGADLLVAALLLATVALLQRNRPMAAGAAIGLATFKFTAIPVLAIVLGWGVLSLSRSEWLTLAAGAAVAQLPNALYFIQYPVDFWFILRHRGALSTYAYSIRPTDTFLVPVRYFQLETLYIDVLFPVVVLLAVGIGILVARRVTLFGGMLVGYFSMSYLIPAESKILPFVILLLVGLIWVDKWWSQPGVAAILVLAAYHFVLQSGFDPNIKTMIQLWEPVRHLSLLVHFSLFVALLFAFRSSPRMVKAGIS